MIQPVIRCSDSHASLETPCMTILHNVVWCIGNCFAWLANPFFYSCLGYHRFRSSSDIYAVAHLVTLFLHSSQHEAALSGLGAPATLEMEVFFSPIHLRCTDPSNSGFCLSVSYSAVAHLCQCLIALQISHSPFIYFAFVVGFYILSRFRLSFSRFLSWRSLPLHSHVGQATKFIYALVAAILFRPVVCLGYFGLYRRLLGSPKFSRLIPTTAWLTQNFSAYTDDCLAHPKFLGLVTPR